MRPARKPRMIYQMMCNIGSVGRRVLISGRPIVGAEMQRLEDLLLSAVERFEFVNVKVFEGLNWGWRSWRFRALTSRPAFNNSFAHSARTRLHD
jgi:hypothetical protein